ncbi:MAG: QueT transporter family protein [Saccharofermentanales bacterium]
MSNDSKPRTSKRAKVALTTLAQSAVIAAVYVALTLITSFMAFQSLQLRLAEALTALPALFPSAIPGVFIGCLLSNALNPSPLGVIDIVFGSLTTLIAALLTWWIARPWRRELAGVTAPGPKRSVLRRVLPLLPPVVLNALVVGTYLPFLLSPDGSPKAIVIAGSIGSIALTEAIVVFALGLPLVGAMARTPWAKRIYLRERERSSKGRRARAEAERRSDASSGGSR